MHGSTRKIKTRPSGAGWRALIFSLCTACLAATLLAQAGRRAHPTTEASSALNVVATRANGATAPITSKDISLFDNGVEQTIKNFAPDLSPARIVLLVDNSLTIRADVEKLEAATREFAYEIYDGDKLLIVGSEARNRGCQRRTRSRQQDKFQAGAQRPAIARHHRLLCASAGPHAWSNPPRRSQTSTSDRRPRRRYRRSHLSD